MKIFDENILFYQFFSTHTTNMRQHFLIKNNKRKPFDTLTLITERFENIEHSAATMYTLKKIKRFYRTLRSSIETVIPLSISAFHYLT